LRYCPLSSEGLKIVSAPIGSGSELSFCLRASVALIT